MYQPILQVLLMCSAHNNDVFGASDDDDAGDDGVVQSPICCPRRRSGPGLVHRLGHDLRTSGYWRGSPTPDARES